MLLAAHGHAQDFKSSVAPGAYSGTLRDRDVGAIIISLVLQPCTCHPPLLRAHKMAGSVAPCPGHFDSDFDVEIVWASPVRISHNTGSNNLTIAIAGGHYQGHVVPGGSY